MEYFTNKLLELGYAYENPRARYVSECLVVPKVSKPVNYKEDYRMVINLKRVNSATEPIYWPLPTMEEVQGYLTGAKYFITLIIVHQEYLINTHMALACKSGHSYKMAR